MHTQIGSRLVVSVVRQHVHGDDQTEREHQRDRQRHQPLGKLRVIAHGALQPSPTYARGRSARGAGRAAEAVWVLLISGEDIGWRGGTVTRAGDTAPDVLALYQTRSILQTLLLRPAGADTTPRYP